MRAIEFDNNIYDTIRRNIRFYRQEKGMTSAELAEITGLSHDFIRQLQSNSKRTYNFSVETFYKICVALDVSLDKMIEKTQTQPLQK
ncbi:MAG: helix-turn-helix transcriptional regulator [Ruminococcaceae bacterium]|nr:helix-turn-helix transcriptional regulator [Oscillospiraceae bacterium]MEE1198059.1 helix-turn-helix transcriptional regulator [Acutalibacteraceae bacterium]